MSYLVDGFQVVFTETKSVRYIRGYRFSLKEFGWQSFLVVSHRMVEEMSFPPTQRRFDAEIPLMISTLEMYSMNEITLMYELGSAFNGVSIFN